MQADRTVSTTGRAGTRRPLQRVRTGGLLMLALAAAVGCARSPAAAPAASAAPTPTQDEFAASHARWIAQRDAELARPDGWLSLTGLHWLDADTQRIGSAAGNDIVLAIAPAQLGQVQRSGEQWRFVPAPGVAVAVNGTPTQQPVILRKADGSQGDALEFDAGKGRVQLIERGGRAALRVHHADAPERAAFAGVTAWPADRSWQVQARFIAHPPGRTLPIVNVIGDVQDVPNPGYVAFERNGAAWTLQVTGDPARGLNLMFKDATNGTQSYAVGRYLKTEPVAADGSVLLDFNRAYNPPCAYTDFATCPLPPAQNVLVNRHAQPEPVRLAVSAGEKAYAGKAHAAQGS